MKKIAITSSAVVFETGNKS